VNTITGRDMRRILAEYSALDQTIDPGISQAGPPISVAPNTNRSISKTQLEISGRTHTQSASTNGASTSTSDQKNHIGPAKVDIDVGINILNWMKPIGRVFDVVDQVVEDKDQRNKLNAALRASEHELQKLSMQVYVQELQVKTIPWADAAHKLARTFLSLASLLVGGGVLIYYIKMGHELDLETFLAIAGISAPGTAYNIVKGKGRDV